MSPGVSSPASSSRQATASSSSTSKGTTYPAACARRRPSSTISVYRAERPSGAGSPTRRSKQNAPSSRRIAGSDSIAKSMSDCHAVRCTACGHGRSHVSSPCARCGWPPSPDKIARPTSPMKRAFVTHSAETSAAAPGAGGTATRDPRRCQAAGARRVTPAMTSIDPPTPMTNGAPEVRPVLAEEVLLARAAHRHEQEIRASSRGSPRTPRRPRRRRNSRRALPPRCSRGILRSKSLHSTLKHLGAGAQEIDAITAALGKLKQRFHEVDAGDTLGKRIAEQPRGPDHALAVGAHQAAAVDDLAQLRVVVHRDELGCVDRHVLRVAARSDGTLDLGQGVRHVQAVDRAAEDVARGQSCEGGGRGFDDRGEGRQDGVRRALGRVTVPQRDGARDGRPARQRHLASGAPDRRRAARSCPG